ncbi:hypothetical protein SAMN04244571_04784 [Azotobacter beijerinckii]|uniref:Uncharacterized protein n=1 Tax=Azotobacter beijerinckii TaxID=170623 RepID=A0A1I1CR51_9GAMM|nr:hypothetical protein SAMN04244571_04784 [Azotobacter beijerinckii]
MSRGSSGIPQAAERTAEKTALPTSSPNAIPPIQPVARNRLSRSCARVIPRRYDRRRSHQLFASQASSSATNQCMIRHCGAAPSTHKAMPTTTNVEAKAASFGQDRSATRPLHEDTGGRKCALANALTSRIPQAPKAGAAGLSGGAFPKRCLPDPASRASQTRAIGWPPGPTRNTPALHSNQRRNTMATGRCGLLQQRQQWMVWTVD